MDVDQCLETCLKGELLSEGEIKEICARVKELLVYESNVVHVKAPCAVVGDIHGYVSLVGLDVFFSFLCSFDFDARSLGNFMIC